jgi:lysozyme
MADMNFSDACINLIKQFEGLARYDQSTGLVYPYKDPIGLPTIGYGSRIDLNECAVTMQTAPMTTDQCEQLLEMVLGQFVDAVNSIVTVDLTQHQFDALVDFAYNAGVGNLKSSTLLKYVNAGNFDAAANEFPKWNKARQNGVLVALPGLTRRRNAERTLFLTPDAQ